MLETLAGRLKWERTIQGIRIEIPARLSWVALFLTGWLAFWLYAGARIIGKMLAGDDQSSWALVWLVGWAAGACFAGCWLIWSVGGRTTLSLDPAEMRIQRRVFGIEWDTRSYRTSSVHNLRYIPGYMSPGAIDGGYVQSSIKFEADDKTRSFATGVSDIEAFAMINRMLEVYNFPKDRALEYIGKP
jgi:hypothetical protein